MILSRVSPGAKVIGQSLRVDLTRDDVVKILRDGFLPITTPDDLPARGRITGLRELGLPFVSDPGITKHLAAFLTQAAAATNPPLACQRMAIRSVRLGLTTGSIYIWNPGITNCS